MAELTGGAAMFDAIRGGDLERVKACLAVDASLVDAKDAGGVSAILTAVYHRQRDIANLLVARGASLTLFEACAAGEVERVERSLEASADANGFSPDGWTPLHLAAFFGHASIVERLLARGAEVNTVGRNATANTPLHAALAGNHKIAAGLLIGHGADVNVADVGGNRPLHIAAANGNLESMKILIAQGAEIGAATSDGSTALSLAEARGHKEAAALLRRHQSQ